MGKIVFAKVTLVWILFAIAKSTPMKYEILETVLYRTPPGGLQENIILAFWFYSEIMLLLLAGYFLVALVGSIILSRTLPYRTYS